MSKITTIEVLFLLLLYLLGFRLRENKKTRYEPLSPEMKEEVRKLHRYSNQIKLVVTEKLSTIEDVKNYISQMEKMIINVTEMRNKYRNKLRNCKDEKLISEYKAKRDECTIILKQYRKNIKIANQIIEDIPKIKARIKIEQEMKREELKQTKNKNREER